MKHVKHAALTLWLFAAALFLYEIYQYAFVQELGIEKALDILSDPFQNAIMSFGNLSPVIFLVLYAVRPFVFFPASAMTLTSVLIFGIPTGLVISYAGELISATIAFFVGKYFGNHLGLSDRVEKTRIGAYLSGNAFISVFLLRLVPIFPFDVVNYASGVARLPFGTYLAATMLGVIPGLSSYLFLGYSLLHTEYLLSALFVFAAFFALTHYIKKYLSAHRT